MTHSGNRYYRVCLARKIERMELDSRPSIGDMIAAERTADSNMSNWLVGLEGCHKAEEKEHKEKVEESYSC